MKTKGDTSEVVAHLRQMAQRQRDLAVEFDQQADKIERRSSSAEVQHDADRGHSWRLAVTMRGSSIVKGDQHHRDAPTFEPLPLVVEVRAWSIRAALAQAAGLPLSVWFGDE